MLNPWLPSQKLNWNSDWDGEEIGYDDVLVVGLYSVQDTDIDVYIDTETGRVLDIWCTKEHEEE